mgnify:FL=1
MRCPARRRMTAVTLQAGAKVTGRFAGGAGAVVAGGTGAGYTTVVEVRRYPGSSSMALIALTIGLNVIRGFSGRGGSIMAALAGSR